MATYNSIIPIMTSNSQDGFTVSATSGMATYHYKGVDGISDGTSYYRSSITPTLPEYYTVTFPRKYKVARYTLYLGYFDTRYTNMATWEFQGLIDGVWTTLHSGSNTQTANTLTFDITPTDVDAIRIKCNSRYGTNSWGFDELIVYEIVYDNKILIFNNNEYKKYSSSTWQTVTTTTPTEADFLNGMDISDVESIPESAWQQLSGNVEILYYTDNPTKTEAEFVIDTNEFTLADELGNGISIIEYTDNPNQTESIVTLETEPFTFYDEMGDSFDVLYYTDDPNKTYANLEITANHSPLDELNDDFEIVTWTNDINEQLNKQIDIIALPKGQSIIPIDSIEVIGELKNIILDRVSHSENNVEKIKILLSKDNGTNWMSFINNTWILVNPDEISIKGIDINDLSNIPSNYYSQFVNNSNLKIMYYIEEGIRQTNPLKLNTVEIEQEANTSGIEINDLAFYVLNTISTINVTFNNNNLQAVIDDIDKGKVQYRILLNGNPFYPIDGNFTNFYNTPTNIKLKLTSNDILIGQNNTLRIEFKDYFGAQDFWETTFVGNYYGLLFSDENMNYFTTDVGKVLKYLDFGIIIAGQTTTEQKVIITNKHNYKIQNLSIEVDNNNLPNGVEIQLSKTINPFLPTNKIVFNEIINEDETREFYVRISTQSNIAPVPNGRFTIKARADKI